VSSHHRRRGSAQLSCQARLLRSFVNDWRLWHLDFNAVRSTLHVPRTTHRAPRTCMHASSVQCTRGICFVMRFLCALARNTAQDKIKLCLCSDECVSVISARYLLPSSVASASPFSYFSYISSLRFCPSPPPLAAESRWMSALSALFCLLDSSPAAP
jgi:hypothetical protein